MSERDRQGFAWPAKTRCAVWAAGSGLLALLGIFAESAPALVGAAVVSPLALYFLTDVIGAPMPLGDSLRLSYRRIADSVRAALRAPWERGLLAALALAALFLVGRTVL
ncbi:hypothetical protein [Streptomyces monomycini]|uniref:hypothetical protein n=1 Tax=Streptomyces monomycini TaxID=371720 RepID=UPI0004AA1941|nr:hypothetical protein [Streptomyces monomycini]